jgi:hypothetical protein
MNLTSLRRAVTKADGRHIAVPVATLRELLAMIDGKTDEQTPAASTDPAAVPDAEPKPKTRRARKPTTNEA